MKYNRQGDLQINAPHTMSQSVIDGFITEKYAWIKSQQNKIKNLPSIKLPTYTNNERHEFMGASYKLQLVQSNQSQVILKPEEMLVFHRKNSSIKNILDSWYKQQSLEYLTERTYELAEKFNFPKIRSIKVRKMRARWGSCSSLSDITYNIHLIKTSNECIDYVIIHELCHLIHPNHSRNFYQLQTQLNPQWKTQKQLLNQTVLS